MKKPPSVILAMWIAAGCGCEAPPQPIDAGEGEPDAGPVEPDAAPIECITGDATSPIGGACNCQRDCVAGAACTPEAEGGGTWGQCNRPCEPGSDQCGAGNVCYEVIGTTMGLCANECETHLDCRDGWACFYGRCSPHCTGDAQCRSGACDPYRASCAAPREAEGGVLAACTNDEECRSGACLRQIGGHCITHCIPEEGGCPEAAHCIGGIDPNDPGVGICMLSCVTTDDCPGQLDCLNGGGGRSVCWIPAP